MRLRDIFLFLTSSTTLLAFGAGPQCRLRLNLNSTDGTPASPENPFPTGTSSGQPPNSTSNSSSIDSSPFPYNKTPVRGVNLGGWFVLEPWITPSMFENTNNDDIIDEYTFGLLQDKDTALQALQSHWDTWITEDDFKLMAAAGLNHVRIPFGYWSVPTSQSVNPYIPGAWPYLLKAINWAKSNSLRVLLDLHGAPGSQNGYDNSGQRTQNYLWAVDEDNVNRTLEVIETVSNLVGGTVDIIELLNEPAGFNGSAFDKILRQFWLDGYQTVRDAAGGAVKVMIGDGFLTPNSWTNFLTAPAQGVIMDYHQYQIFSVPELQRSDAERMQHACSLIPELRDFSDNNIWLVMGEWSAAKTDCARWLNGRGVYDGTYFGQNDPLGSCANLTGDSSNFSDGYKAFLRQYWEAQVDVGEAVQGWIWWTWRAENADEWDYRKGLAGGWIPMDPSERKFPQLCTTD